MKSHKFSDDNADFRQEVVKPRLLIWTWLLIYLALALACSPSKVEQIQTVPAVDPLAIPRAILQRYIRGEPLGSEVDAYPGLVEKLRQRDPYKAKLLQQGLEKIQASIPSQRPGIAQDLLDQLSR